MNRVFSSVVIPQSTQPKKNVFCSGVSGVFVTQSETLRSEPSEPISESVREGEGMNEGTADAVTVLCDGQPTPPITQNFREASLVELQHSDLTDREEDSFFLQSNISTYLFLNAV